MIPILCTEMVKYTSELTNRQLVKEVSSFDGQELIGNAAGDTILDEG